MDEDSRLSSSTSQQQQQQQPSTSALTPPPSSSSPTDSSVSSTTTTTPEKQQQANTQQPSTSKTCKEETREFGYSEALPFAPWRRKRYGLTVQGLHEEIVDMFHWIKPNEIETRLRTKVYEKVRDSVLRRWKHKTVKISMFGSLRTNLFLPTSDIDVLVECDDWVGSNPNDENQEDWLSETARQLEDDRIAESVTVYGGAFVPIVKMVDRDTRLSVDISFNTVQGVRAASYIAKVKEEFPLIEPLVLLLKQFLHYRNLNQTFTGGLSSYGLVLLLVNFFQLYALNMRHRTIYDRGVNLGHLLLRFLELYSLEFNYEEIGISPGQACYIPKAAAGARYGLKRAQPGNLALEDPLLTANDVGRSTYNFSSIANAFGQALQILMVAVTLRERKGRNQLATKIYKGSLLHMIMPFTAKELTYRNWLMSGVLSMPRKDGSASYDLNLLHNTLVSPTVDLSRYGWLRKVPPCSEKYDSRPMKVPDSATDVKSQVLQQLKAKLAEEEKLQKARASGQTDTTPDAATPTVDTPKAVASNVSDLAMTAPPIATNTASVNTSATVSTAASISERDDTDSPGLSSSMGTPSSEDDEECIVNRRKTSGAAPVQFKKPFNEVVAQSKSKGEYSKRTQTNFDEPKMEEGYANGYVAKFNDHGNAYRMAGNPYMNYATVAAGPQTNLQSVSRMRPGTYNQRNRHHSRNHSQGSDGSDGYNRSRWPHCGTNNNNQQHHQHQQQVVMYMGHNMQQPMRGRRGGRAASRSSNHSRHSSDSGSRTRTGKPIWPSATHLPVVQQHDRSADATLTEDGGAEKNTTLTQDGCRGNEEVVPRKYADAVKKKVSGANMDPNVVNGNVVRNGMPSSQQPPVDRSYCGAIKTNLYPKSALPPNTMIPPPAIVDLSMVPKGNEYGLDTKNVGVIMSPADLAHLTSHQGIPSN